MLIFKAYHGTNKEEVNNLITVTETIYSVRKSQKDLNLEGLLSNTRRAALTWNLPHNHVKICANLLSFKKRLQAKSHLY